MPDRLYDEIATAFAAYGLALRGGFAPVAGDGVPVAGEGAASRAVLLVGNVGAAIWPAFAPRAGEGPDALDRWTRAIVEPVAARFGARAVYPFEAPPLPFQRWAMKAEAVAPSPLGILIHPDHGLWHAWRAALLFAGEIALPPRGDRARPCDACAARPCLSACPVGAFTDAGYDVAACAGHLDSRAGADCLNRGCRARAACPVGGGYAPEQIRFHMRAFHRAVSRAGKPSP